MPLVRQFTPTRILAAAFLFVAAAQIAVVLVEVYPFSSGLGELGVRIVAYGFITVLFVAALGCLLLSWWRRHAFDSQHWLHRTTVFSVLLLLLNLIYFTWLPTAERLGIAASRGNAEVVSRCLFWGVSPNATYIEAAGFGGRHRSVPPLERAAVGGHVGVMALLLDAGADINSNHSGALRSAINGGHVRAVAVLLDHGASPTSAVDVAMQAHFGTGAGEIEALHYLLVSRPDALFGPGLLLMTAYHGTPRAAQEIAAVEVNRRYGTVYELLRQLMLERSTEAAYRAAAASLAMPDGDKARLQALEHLHYLSEPRDLELAHLTGELVLNLAVKFGDPTLTAVLLADGIPPEPPLDERQQLLTPLHRAISLNRLGLAQMLITAGADLNRPNRTFGRPLHLAVQSGSVAMLKLLIEAGAPLDAPETESVNGTALFLAVHYDDLERTRILVQAGADPRAVGWSAGTACDLAQDKPSVRAYMASVCDGALDNG